MLMAWGPFRFTVPTYAVETIRRSIQPRTAAQPIIGAAPTIHRLGPGNEEMTLESTFYPKFLNGRGLSQVAGIRQAVNALTPMQLVHVNSAGINIFGTWIATAIANEETTIGADGTPQVVTATLSMVRYDQSSARMVAMAVALGGVSGGIGGSSLAASLRLGF